MQSAISSGIENIACERDRGCALAVKPPATICDPFRIKEAKGREAKGRDTAHLWLGTSSEENNLDHNKRKIPPHGMLRFLDDSKWIR